MKSALHLGKASFSLNWKQISNNLLSILWQLALTTFIFYLISHFGKKIIYSYLERKRRNAKNKRTKTITALINSVFQYTVIFFYLFGVLSIIGVPVGTLLASAGIFSLALGMGAQGFVSDLVNGFFILSEDQFDVGDTVLINSQVGIVIQLGLRTTRLRTSDGSIIFIPNRDISIVKNLAHDAIGMSIYLELDANNDFSKVTEIINHVNQNTHPKTGTLVGKPTITGIVSQNGETIKFGIWFKVKFDKQSVIQNMYYARYIEALQKAGIKFAKTTSMIPTKTG